MLEKWIKKRSWKMLILPTDLCISLCVFSFNDHFVTPNCCSRGGHKGKCKGLKVTPRRPLRAFPLRLCVDQQVGLNTMIIKKTRGRHESTLPVCRRAGKG
jgi:hypothetical protein